MGSLPLTEKKAPIQVLCQYEARLAEDLQACKCHRQDKVDIVPPARYATTLRKVHRSTLCSGNFGSAALSH